MDKRRPHRPDVGHTNTEPAVTPNLSSERRILRVQLQYDHLISPNVKIKKKITFLKSIWFSQF